MAEAPKAAWLDLENELTCSICTEVLYQPLTLLDCLHTFCGSCLKVWFVWQASQVSDAQINPYTCPSCRATVRGTRPDAKITTLLEMFLQANPSKAKTDEEKKSVQENYKPGEDILLKLETTRDDLDEADRRMVEEVRELSLRDIDGRSQRSYERGVRHRRRSRDTRHDGRTSGGHSPAERAQASTDSRSHARQIEHQSSLRSLISASDVDSAAMEEEIVRQIEEEGLLDDIDFQGLDASQVDELYEQLSERIADAYRRRHGQRTVLREHHSSGTRRNEAVEPAASTSRTPTRQHARSTTETPATNSHPPISRPHLLEAYPTAESHRRRISSEGRRQTSPIPRTSPVRREAARSATDLSHTQRSTRNEDSRSNEILAVHGRRATDPRPRRLSESTRRPGSGPTPDNALRTGDGLSRSAAMASLSPTSARHTSSLTRQNNSPSNSPRVPHSTIVPRPSTSTSHHNTSNPIPPSVSNGTFDTRVTLYSEPSYSCERCGKANIQYERHENCSICKTGNYNICHRCYRTNKGCLNWYGFGNLAWPKFRQSASSHQELPHSLVSQKFLRPKAETQHTSNDTGGGTKTTETPSRRLQSGLFCSICSSYANDCFWRCESCNDGEWGFCNSCVNQGRCCTHPLLPIAHVSAAKSKSSSASNLREVSFALITSPSMVQTYPPSNVTTPGQYRPLTFSTNCDICHYPVQPSQSRYHCYQCSSGDYDICVTCYAKLVDTGRISRDNGDKGWRRCLRGHRMIIFYFEDSPLGQRRVIVNDLVGGHFLENDGEGLFAEQEKGVWRWVESGERKTRTVSRQHWQNGSGASQARTHNLQKFPPDGGVGIVARAAHAWVPAEDVDNELGFPRGAEIREAVKISDEWYLGYYAGNKGLFPLNYVRVLRVVTM